MASELIDTAIGSKIPAPHDERLWLPRGKGVDVSQHAPQPEVAEMNDVQKVDIAAAGKYHAYHLATELASLSRLGDLYSVHRRLSPPTNVAKSAFHNRFDLAAWGALSKYVSLGYTEDIKFEMFDNWLAKQLAKKTPGILHSWNGNSNETFKRLKGSGWRLCLERSCPHGQVQHDLMVEESTAIDVPYTHDMRALERSIEEYHLADIIVAPSTYSARSYTTPELKDKVRINPLGGNVKYRERVSKSARGSSKSGIKVLSVGNNFLRKGTHYLIEAFKQISDPDAELWIRGGVPESYRKRIQDSRVKIIPPVLPDQLRKLYETADVFVQSSIDEGFGMTVFEALGYGLPLVVTENVGANDLLSPQVAVTVPIRDPLAIVAAINLALDLPGEAFDVARKSILEKNTWSACVQRMFDGVYVDS